MKKLYFQSYKNYKQFCTKEKFLVLLPYILKYCIIFAVLYYALSLIHSESYIWQCTTLGDMIQPVRRKVCALPVSTTITAEKSDKKPKIGMLMVYDNSDGNWNEELMKQVVKNREKYCMKHGYHLITGNDLLDRSRPTAWSKIKAMNHYLNEYDYVLYIDMDVVIMNFEQSLTNFIDLAPEKDFIMTEDWSGVNTGVWLAKNTQFSHWFLEAAWNQTQLIPRLSFDGKPHPFEYEQRAFHFLLQTDVWRNRHLPVYRGNYKELREHFMILPQCSMNSYIMYPYYWKGNREISHYVDGDFVVHFAGKKGKVKTNLMNYYLDLASKK
jgi:hypothetical protein